MVNPRETEQWRIIQNNLRQIADLEENEFQDTLDPNLLDAAQTQAENNGTVYSTTAQRRNQKAAATGVGPSPSGSEPVTTQTATATPDPVTPGADGMANMTGWAAQQNFNPTELEHIYNNPQAILPYIFGQMQPGSPGYSRLRNLQWDPLAMLTLTKGSDQMLGDASTWGGPGGYANFLNELYSNIGTAGGQGLNAAELMRNIFQQEGTSTGDATTALGNMLGAGDATQQARTLYNLIRDITTAGMNPLAAQAMQAATMNQLDRYNSSVLTQDSENVPSAVDYLRQNAPHLNALG